MPLREFIKLLTKEKPADCSVGVGRKSFDSSWLVGALEPRVRRKGGEGSRKSPLEV